ncbi:hypothetical protein ON010_g2846 [Phytophthora cinnamomi]|nr:hypothetical protein ON010_g2846 [Phytophthora cinnamomi]
MILAQRAQWTTDQFESHAVVDIIKRKAELVDATDPLRQRKRHCSYSVWTADGLLLEDIADVKAWHANNSTSGFSVRSMWNMIEGIQFY